MLCPQKRRESIYVSFNEPPTSSALEIPEEDRHLHGLRARNYAINLERRANRYVFHGLDTVLRNDEISL